MGSTAVKGLKSKPIIDILIGVKDFEDIMKFKEKLEQKGFIYRDKPESNEWQRFFITGDIENDFVTSHIHSVIYNSENWTEIILFRDALNKYLDLKEKYLKVKEQAAEVYKNNRKEYTNSKNKVIIEIIKIAKEREQI